MVVATYDSTLFITTFVGEGGLALGIIGVFGLISAISTFCLLFYLLVPAFRRLYFPAEISKGVSQFVRDPLGWMFVCMLFSDFLQGCGFVMNLRWASSAKIWAGSACSFQSAVTEIGDVGGALFSLEITVYTFLVLFVRYTPPAWASVVVMLLTWLLLIVLATIGPLVLQKDSKGPFYDSSGAWCWIGKDYQVERFFFLYFFIFLSVACSWICYSMLFVRASKVMSNKASREEAFRSSQGGKSQAAAEVKDELGEKINAMSRRMICGRGARQYLSSLSHGPQRCSSRLLHLCRNPLLEQWNRQRHPLLHHPSILHRPSSSKSHHLHPNQDCHNISSGGRLSR